MIKLAWRNIWRNHRRSFISIASIFFSVLFCILTISLQNGQWDSMIDNVLRTQTGHIQVHLKGYWEDKIMDHFMTMDESTIKKIEELPYIDNVSPRVETFAMASTQNTSKAVALIGIDPAREDKKSALKSHLIAGRYLTPQDNGILIGKELSEYLQIKVGDTIAMIGQGYHGSGAAGLFPVRGIVALVTPEMNKSFIYTSLPAAQTFIDLPDGLSGLLISITKNNKLNEVMDEVKQTVPSDLDVLSWKVTMEKIMGQASSDKAFMKLIMFILYIIVGFGILSTVIMMTNERRHEFGVVAALGMQRKRLAGTVGLELLLMSLMGILSSVIVCIPIVLYFSIHPIPVTGDLAKVMHDYGMKAELPLDANPRIFITQTCIIIAISAITVLFPIYKILKFKIVDAIRK